MLSVSNRSIAADLSDLRALWRRATVAQSHLDGNAWLVVLTGQLRACELTLSRLSTADMSRYSFVPRRGRALAAAHTWVTLPIDLWMVVEAWAQ
jgi:hypothetical protein